MRKELRSHLYKDIGIVFLSVLIALILVKTNVLVSLLTSTKELEYLGSFVTGMFFTSVFTTAPAIVTLGELAQVHGIFQTALLGALGAIVGDLVIFKFVRDNVSEHLREVLHAKKHKIKKAPTTLRLKIFRWLTFLAGGIIIASPLPDELGIGLLGFSKMRLPLFILFSFAFNFIGIVLIGELAKVF